MDIPHPDGSDHANSRELEARHVLEVHQHPKVGMRIEVVSPYDSRVDTAIDIEVAALAALGDKAEEVREEYTPYRNKSLYFLVFDDTSEGKPEDMLGMGRLIPHSEELGNKTLNDLAKLSWKTDKIESTGDGENAEDIVQAFLTESGCEDMAKVWDMATLAMRLDIPELKQAKVADRIVASFAQEIIAAWKRGELTHLTSFDEEYAFTVFSDKMGYPFHKMFGLSTLSYDSFGTGDSMVAQPSWIAAEGINQVIKDASTKHLARVVLKESVSSSIVDRAFARSEQ